MFSMFMITVLVGVYMLAVRVKSVKHGEVSNRYFKLMKGQEVPDVVNQVSRNFVNQFETPVLFYVAGCLYLIQGFDSQLALYVAWLFVVFRAIHAFVHVTSNKLSLRMASFGIAFIFLTIMWLELLRLNLS